MQHLGMLLKTASRVIWGQKTEVRFQREKKSVRAKKSTWETLQMKEKNVLTPSRTNPESKTLKRVVWVVLVLCQLESKTGCLTSN